MTAAVTAGRPLRFDLHELGGALGDVGILVPIIGALIVKNGFNPTSVLLVFGLTYIAAGLYFRLPIPVQPLKAMAAIAIAQGLSPETVSAAGLIMGVLLLLLALTGLITPLAALFPKAVIRGIQVAVGLLLAQAGFKLLFDSHIVPNGPETFVGIGGQAIPAAALMAVGTAAGMLLLLRRPRLPVTLLVLLPAALLGAVLSPAVFPNGLRLGPAMPSLDFPGTSQLLTAFVVLVIPQLPLTLGNAVIACADTARGYFRQDADRVTHRSLLISKGLANIFAGGIGGMPVCHGAGGLTAHYQFGARTGGATIMMGAILLTLGLAFGRSAGAIFALVPLPVLGVLLCVVGLQHALLARDTRPGVEWLVVAVIATASLLTNNVAIGFASGIALYQAARLPRGYAWVRSRFPAAFPTALGRSGDGSPAVPKLVRKDV